MKKCIIIGAGISGLAAAALLAQQGFDVTVLEKNNQPGGRAGVWKKDGFTFDMGPSWYLMPEVFENFFKAVGKKSSDYFKLKQLDPSYKIFFSKDSTVDLPAKLEQTLDLFEELEPGGREILTNYLKQSKFLYEESINHFMYRDYRSIFDFLRKDIILNGPKMHIFESIDSFTKRYFKSDLARKILMYNIVFLGGTPTNTPALYSLMSHIDFELGVWYPMGGISSFITALVKIAEEKGAKIIYNQEVTQLPVDSDGTIHQVVTKRKTYSADIVLSSNDYPYTETQLLPREAQTFPARYWQKKTIAPSAFILYLGINKKLKKLRHHNLFLDHDWMRHFDSIFKNPSWPAEPSYYVCAPSKTDASVAPKGMENLFILVPVAAGLEDTPAIRKKYTNQIISHLEGLIGQEFADNIVFKQTFAHNDYEKYFHAYQGTALGLSHTVFQSALFRPGHQSKKVKNLFYTGQYTHPGIGMPTCLISSHIAAELIQKHYG